MHVSHELVEKRQCCSIFRSKQLTSL